ncbi:MAG: PmoA family protein [Candidatus Brocadiia bacterium]
MAKSRLVVEAGPRPRHDVPMGMPIGRAKKAKLTDETTQRVVPCQVVRGELCWMLDHIPPGEEKHYLLETGRGSRAGGKAAEATRDGDAVHFFVRGKLFTTYNFAKDWARPFFYPLYGPEQTPITRSYPLVDNVPGETTDHPHHKSLWVAHGDVSGADNWSEEKGHGRQVSRRVKELSDGPVAALLRQDLDWVSNRGKKLCSEEREVRVYAASPEERIMDLSVTFKATSRKVTFGDTKEGGLCSVRVATSMDGNKDGSIENSYGAIGEDETWGRRAVWCDYSGPVRGKLVGIAVFDTPTNFRYPTYWHVRDYGLMTANPFGISYFQPDSGETGEYTLKAGEQLRFDYRIFIHLGDASVARVREKYHDYINPPKVTRQR